MANIKFFADLGAEVVEANRADYRGRTPFIWNAKAGEWIKATRVVEYKSHPSRHDCDARCYNATGRTMRCECACGGKNHGRGRVSCEAA